MTRSERKRLDWLDPDKRARMTAAAKRNTKRRKPFSPETREKLKAILARPDVQARRIAALRSPEARAKLSAAARRPEAMERFERNRADRLSAEERALVIQAVQSGQRRMDVGFDWLITESAVSKIMLAAKKAEPCP